MKEWIVEDISGSNVPGDDDDWSVKFSLILWWIWKWRNSKVFKERQFPEDPIPFL